MKNIKESNSKLRDDLYNKERIIVEKKNEISILKESILYLENSIIEKDKMIKRIVFTSNLYVPKIVMNLV
jgi:hypothetical protein